MDVRLELRIRFPLWCLGQRMGGGAHTFSFSSQSSSNRYNDHFWSPALPALSTVAVSEARDVSWGGGSQCRAWRKGPWGLSPAQEPSQKIWNFLDLRSRGHLFLILIFPPRRNHLLALSHEAEIWLQNLLRCHHLNLPGCRVTGMTAGVSGDNEGEDRCQLPVPVKDPQQM